MSKYFLPQMLPDYCKCLLWLFLSLPVALPARAQLAAFGEWSIDGGTTLRAAPGHALGFAAHGMGGIQYWIVALDLGFGVIHMPDERSPARPLSETIGIDFPAGLALRIPVGRQLLLVAGSDVSGFGSLRNTIYQPHIGLLIFRSRRYFGFYLKAMISANDQWPTYIGIGLKMTLKG